MFKSAATGYYVGHAGEPTTNAPVHASTKAGERDIQPDEKDPSNFVYVARLPPITILGCEGSPSA